MGRVATPTNWVGQMNCLTVHPEGALPADQLMVAQTRVARLALHVQRLADADAADLTAIPCGQEAGQLAEDLAAALPLVVGAERVRIADDGPLLVAGYLQALRDAACAVYYCRRVQHPAGCCWFSVHGPADDLCGRVLALTHRLRG